jgi:hypothetical protein
MFICHHCPFVRHVKSELAQLGRDYAEQGVGIVGISSNDPRISADDSPEGLQRMAAEWGFDFPVCYDETQAVAKSYAAPVLLISICSISIANWCTGASSTTAAPAMGNP